MSYLLPCPHCGHKLAVTTGQAGERIRCVCGTPLDVPTVRGLRALEPAPQSTPRTSNWTARHSAIFLGVLLALVGIGFGIFLQLRASEVYPRNTFADKIRTMAPYESWDLWSKYLRNGLGWQPQTGPQREAALRWYAELRRWAIVGYCVGGLGIVVATAGFAFIKPRDAASKRPRRQPPPAKQST